MKTSFTHTQKWKNRTQVYHDVNRSRFVVGRRSGNVRRVTSVRYGALTTFRIAHIHARMLALRLKSCPANKLRYFKFTP
jgi:hypothetical protein